MGGESDDDFANYEPTTHNPGWNFNLIIVCVCILINLSLPLWLRLGDLCKKDETEGDGAQRVQEEGFFTKSTVSGSVASKNTTSSRRGPRSVVSTTSSALLTDVASAILDARPRRNAGTHLKGPKKRRHPTGRVERDVRMAAEHTMAENALQHGSTADGWLPTSECGSARGDRSVASLSIMSKLDLDAISVRDAVDANDTGILPLTSVGHSTSQGWTKLLEVADWDKEMKKYTTLAVPLAIQGLTREFFSILNVAVIGHFIGVSEGNAYVTVNILVLFTGTLTQGFSECIGVLVPHANGAGNDVLVGRYLQLGIVFYTILSIPGAVLWIFCTEKAILWFGFDEQTAAIGQSYAYTVVIYLFLQGFHYCFTEFLNTLDHENYSTIFSIVAHGTQSAAIVIMAVAGVKDLLVVGMGQVALGILEIIVNLTVMTYKGWLDDYWEGLVGTNGLKDGRAVRVMFITAIPLSVAWLLTYGEWEVMTLFAAHMGSAEVAAWGMIGYVWSTFEAITNAFSAASEVRVGFRMGAGQVQIAKIVAEKGIYFGFMVATFCCGLLFMLAQYVPGWLTPDPTLQKLLFDMLPLIGFGEILMVPGMVAWAIIGAQGRIRLATAIEFFVSWFIALPLAAILVYAFNFNLEGLVGSLVVGYTIGANIFLYILYRSDWQALSAVVVARNAAEGVMYDEFDWDDLPPDIQDAARTLGYTKVLWENEGEPASNQKSWNELTIQEQAAASLLGFNRKKWDNDSDTREEDDSRDDETMPYDGYKWSDLPPNALKAAIALGYTEQAWDSNGEGSMDRMEWTQLSSDQKEAARILGYSKQKWDEDVENKDLPSYDDDNWNDLPLVVRKAALQLGYTKQIWDSSGSVAVDDKEWKELTPKQQDAAKILGYDEWKWNKDRVGDESNEREVLPPNDDDWDGLPTNVRKAAQVLGFSKQLWNSGGKSPLDYKDWFELTPKQQDAARTVGLNEFNWNDGQNADGAPITKKELSRMESSGAGERSSCQSDGSRGDSNSAEDQMPDRGILGSSDALSLESKSLTPSLPSVSEFKADVAAMLFELQNVTSEKVEDAHPDSSNLPNYDDYLWRRLPPQAQRAATVLGYSQETWDNDGIPPSAVKDWIDLSPKERNAAWILGYRQSTWDAE